MKTVKRKAEVGETVKSLTSERIGKVVRELNDGVLEVYHESESYTGNIYLSPGRYEVIVEDEPELGMTEELEKKRQQLERKHGGSVRFVPGTDNLPPHSSHYHQNGLDPLEVMRRTFPPEQYEGFLRGNLLKYTMRYDRKGQEAEDLEKAEFYSEALKRWKEGVE